MTPEHEHCLRDLYDHLIRISDLVDSYRDLLSGSMDACLPMVSNRLNVVMKQLTIIATVFLPPARVARGVAVGEGSARYARLGPG
jgi:magnesium transporter